MKFEIIYIIGIILVAFGLLIYSSRKKNKDDGLNFTLKLPKIIEYIGIIGLTIALGVFIFEFSEIKKTEILPISLMVLGIVFLCVYLVLIVEFSETKINDEYLIQKSFGKKKILKWDDIIKVDLNQFSGYIVLFSNDKKIKVSVYNIGYSYFLNEVKNRTDLI